MFDSISNGSESTATLTVIDFISRGIRFTGVAFIGLGGYSVIKALITSMKMLTTFGTDVFNGPLVVMILLTMLHIFFVALSFRVVKRLFRAADRGQHMTAIVRQGIRGQDVIPAMEATPIELVDDKFAALIREHFGSQPDFFDRSHQVWHGTSCLCSRCMATPDTG